MPFLKFSDLRLKKARELEDLYEKNCGAQSGSQAEAEQSSNRYKIELVLRERDDFRNRILCWFGILVAIVIAALNSC